ncbi:MAG TPA: DPP IV N-terminal domain-containing protein [Gemmatimonadales bacterium]|nr:DPP IV N-terminal domain-containing protein [Gemmatimonadales bacterium]
MPATSGAGAETPALDHVAGIQIREADLKGREYARRDPCGATFPAPSRTHGDLMTRRHALLVLLSFAGVGVAAAPLAAQVPELSVHNIFGTREFANDLLDAQWRRDGSTYTLLDTDSSDQTNLYQVDAATGARTLLVRGADLVAPDGRDPIDVQGYQFSADGTKLLIYTNSARVWRLNTKGTYYVWDLTRRRLTPMSRNPGYQMFAKLSPDGRRVAFVRDHNIFVADLESGTETAVTTDGSDDVINGTSDWVYEEELDLRDAFRWSPDGLRIAFWRFDQSAIQPFFLLNADPLYASLFPVRYPKAGTPNAQVRIGVAELASGRVTWIDLGPDRDIYVAAMDFADSPTELWLTRLNRRQNELDLLMADARTGASHVIVSDTDSAWVDAHEPVWMDGGRRFLLESERDGYAHLYLYARDGTLIRRVTTGNWDVEAVAAVDDAAHVVYLTGSSDGPLTRPLLRVPLDGTAATPVSRERGWHTVEFDAARHYYVDVYSHAGAPPVEELRRADGTLVRTLADNATLAGKVQALGLRPPEFFQVKADDGEALNGLLVKPRDFDPAKRYPLLLYVYGGPGSQSAVDEWGGLEYLWYQMLAQQGYLVATVDNRGTGGRGAAFRKTVYLRLGHDESLDQIAAARQLGALPYVDPARIGLWGWSYGGYLAARTLFLSGGVFEAAMAVAPVTDWRLYDTIYTERYMRLPAENRDGYDESAVLPYADSLRGRFLLVHGTGDDNVHFQNSLRLIERLELANKQFDMRIYPNKTHSISGGTTRENLFGLLTEWLKANL